jgi:hypothetical protein
VGLQNVSLKTWREETTWDPGTDGRIILRLILKEQFEDVKWIHLTRVEDKWRALVEMVTNLRRP